ncbi:odorant receptor 13a-like [Agrilus planipennis]|uniref:Odorant receptor n=1 Tax=Agrilus planipennis TaxID=224129 RepID=A0A1W4W5V0_AGRPL|nr:odorant receptor 13a-like [Agrilus planipennis]
MIKREALECALFCLQMSGQDPYKLQTLFSKFVNGIWLIFIIIFTPCIVTEIFAGSDELTNIADAASNIFIYVAAIYKVWNLLRGRQIIIELVTQLDDFWTSDVFDRDWKRNFEISTDRKVVKVCKLVGGLYISCGVYYAVRPLFLQRKVWPVSVYVIPAINNISGSYCIMYMVETVLILLIAFNMTGHDSLIFTLVYYAVLELRALQKALKDLIAHEDNEDELLRKLKIYVKCHDKLHKYIEKVNELFSLFFLYQFFFTTIGICIAIFIMSISISTFHYDDVFKFVLQTMCVYVQMTLYCKGGSDLAYESEALGQAIYESDWTSACQPKVRKMMITIIHRSQKTARLNAGGLFDMNLNSLTSAAKATFSYFTLLRTLYTKHNLYK